MKAIVFVSSKTSNSYMDIIKMPYSAFLGFNYYLQQFDVEKYEMQKGLVNEQNYSNEDTYINQTEPDMDSIRPLLKKER